MSSDFVPILAYDIWPDGQATAATDTATKPAVGAALRWIHLDLNTPRIENWCEALLPPLASRTLLAARTRPRVDTHDDGLVVTLRGVNLNEGSEIEDMVSLRVWMTATLVVTVRKMRVFALDDLREQIRAQDAPPTAARMIARITESLVDRIETVSLDIEDRTSDMEDTVYEDGKKETPDLAPLRRSVITLRRHIGPLADALSHLAQIDTPLIEDSFRNRLRHTANRARRSVDEVHEVADRLDALSQHINLHLEARLARNSYVLSVIAAIFLPLGFLTGLFGVNVAGMPGLENPQSFAILCAAMVILGLLLYFLLRLIKWF